VHPYKPTQAYALVCNPWQLFPTAGFQLTKLARVILYWLEIVAQFRPDLARWNFLQFLTMLS
jgi:hypothetical protein